MTRPHPSPLSESAARVWAPLARFIDAEARLGRAAEARGPAAAAAYEFLRFGIKQGWACLFGGLMCGLLIATHLWWPPHFVLARYDFLVLAAMAIQLAMLWGRLETWDEVKVILLFHAVGTGMEIFKTAMGSWIYPEPSLLRIGGVPLFTGFMYGAVGSYLARVWRLFDFRFTHHPPLWAAALLAGASYVNFFAHHFLPDARNLMFALSAALFWRTTVHFKVWRVHRSMPLLLGFLLVALFIWLAENIGTASGAWLYPAQRHHWSVVPLAKLGSWFMLMMLSYVMVAVVNRPAPPAAVALRRSPMLA